MKCSIHSCQNEATGTAWQGYHGFDRQVLACSPVCESHSDMYQPFEWEEYGRSYGYVPGKVYTSPDKMEKEIFGYGKKSMWQKGRSGRSRRYMKKHSRCDNYLSIPK